MTIIVELTDLANLNNPTTAVASINANNEVIESGLVSAYNVVGDQLLGTMDANNQQIINLPAPAGLNSPARLVDVLSTSITGTVPATGTSGHAVPYLDTNNTWTGNQNFTSNIKVTSFTGPINVNGSSTNFGLVLSTVSNADPAQGGQIQLTNAGSTSQFPNKYIRVDQIGSMEIIDSAYTSSLMTISNTAVTTIGTASTPGALILNGPMTGNIKGTLAGTTATGFVGEVVSASNAGTTITANTSTVIASMNLTAGSWLLFANCNLQTSTTSGIMVASIEINGTPQLSSNFFFSGAVPGLNQYNTMVGPIPLRQGTAFSAQLAAQVNTTGTPTASGNIYAMRFA